MSYTLIDLERQVKLQERGWPGHFILGQSCVFHRNTLITYDDVEIVVSTVGLLKSRNIDHGYEEVGPGRFFETMAFFASKNDTRYKDADVTRQIRFDSPWRISEVDADDKANEMHDAVVQELTQKLLFQEEIRECN